MVDVDRLRGSPDEDNELTPPNPWAETGILDPPVEGSAEAKASRLEMSATLQGDGSLGDGSSGDNDRDPGTTHAPMARGALVGRYITLSVLGAGAMGVVYAAYDPELERKVALKLLRPSALSMDYARLLREARTLARVAHPNVVSVFDVGTVGREVFIAMELVEGKTFGAWMRQRERTIRELLEIFTAAARGLAAAHRAGISHRDFKPDNVMVDNDGRVRVLDFGLARAGPGAAPGPALEAMPVSETGSAAEICLTREGAVVGTPAYMAPEQWHGGAGTASSDQFSFCVALWEALFGQRPFHGETIYALMLAVTAGKVDAPGPSARRVPVFLRRALERGLSVAPERRFATMDELLAALGRGPALQRRRRIVLGLAIVGLVPAGMLGLRAQRIAGCAAAGSEITEVWNDEKKQALRAALAATGVNYAETSYEKAAARIDTWTDSWAQARTQMCREATVDGTRSPEIHALAMECLEERRQSLASTIAVFMDGSATDVARLVPAAAGLVPLAPCMENHSLERRPALPVAPDERLRVEALRLDLMRVHGLWIAGRYQEGLAEGERLLAEVEPLGYRPLDAEARALFGVLEIQLNHSDRAETTFRRAFLDAGSIGLDELAAVAAVHLVEVVGVRRARPGEGLQWALAAEVFIHRLAQERGLLGASLLHHKAMVVRIQGDYEEALAHNERALAIREDVLGPSHPEVAASLNAVANVQRDRGQYDQALAALQRALEIRQEALGPDHPAVAVTLNDLALLEQSRGNYGESQSYFERALKLMEATYGADSLDVAKTLNNLGRVHHMRGNYGDAQDLLERALAIRERRLDPHHLDLATSLQYLGLLHLVRGDRLRARDLLERVLAIRQRHMDASNPEILNILDSLGTVYFRIGDHEKALAMHEQALAMQRVKLGPRHASVAHSLRNLALVRRVRGEHDEALALATEALAMGEAVLGAEHPDISTFLSTLGMVERDRDAAAAEAHLTRALAISLRTRGPEHPATAQTLQRLGEVLLDRGAHQEARGQLERALAIREKVGPESPEVADVLVSLAAGATARGQPEQAIPWLERATKIRSGGGVPIYDLAEARFALARALQAAAPGQGHDPVRARQLAMQAATGYQTAGERFADDRAALESWLRK